MTGCLRVVSIARDRLAGDGAVIFIKREVGKRDQNSAVLLDRFLANAATVATRSQPLAVLIWPHNAHFIHIHLEIDNAAVVNRR